MKKMQQGFTLIELMIVVAIVGVLAAIAIPAYQDYVTRAKVTEGMSLASAAKTAVTEYYQANSAFPTTNAAAGLAATISGTNVSGVVVGTGGVITVTYGGGAPSTISGKTLALTPTVSNGSVTWVCSAAASSAPVPAQYVPSSCR